MKFSSHTFLISLFFFALLALNVPAFSQKKVKLQHSDELRHGKAGDERFDRLIGNVIMVQNATTIYCDSAHFFRKRNSVEAFGHVHIVDGDSIDITGARAEYDGNTKRAKLRNRVVFTKLATATLYTDYLDFSRTKNLAHYFNGGKLVDTTNTLTSDKGYYNTISNLASFKKDVHVTNPDYNMYSDSLQYNSRTKIIYFVTTTKVIDKDSATFVYNKGFYDTKTKVSDVKKGTGESEAYQIVGDDYDYDGILNVGKVRGNVVMTSKKENLQIHGQASDYFKATGITKVYNHAYVAKATQDDDTLFLTADTLVSIDSDDDTKKRILAYKNVKIYKKDMQGLADSLEYRPSDSTIYFYKKPVLWSEGNQMTADSIRMLIQHNTISKVYLVSNAFVIAQDTLKNFNQIKGRRMTAELANSKIHRVMVTGNGETLYHALTEDNKGLMGVNRSVSSRITIRFKDGKVNNLTFYVKPDAKFIPPHELKKDDKTLKGFEWKGNDKPLREDVVKLLKPSPAKPSVQTKPTKKAAP